MTEQPLDRFDRRLADLMTAYGDRAVTTYDPAAVARRAVTQRGPRRLHLALAIGRHGRTLLVVGGLALLAILAGLIIGSRQPSPIGDSFASPTALAWSPDGATLAFLVDVADARANGPLDVSKGRPSHPELWVVRGDGGDPRQLATFGSMASVGQPLWTRDGGSLLVAVGPSGGGVGQWTIRSIGIDGSAPQTLVDAPVDYLALDGLSPNGDRLLYSRSTTSRTDEEVLDLADGSTRRLTTIRGTYRGCRSWSPDGRWILCDVDDRDGGGYPTAGSATVVVASDGSASHRIGACCSIGWSSDGRALFSPIDAVNTVYSSAPDGTDVRVVLDSDAPWGWTPSPDGTRWAAATYSGLVIATPGGAPTTLTTDPGDQGPMWSPDGAWIAFAGVRDGAHGLYVVPATGGEPHLAASNTGLDQWRPGEGGAELTLVRDRAIVMVDPATTGSHELVTRHTIAGDPVEPPVGADSEATIVIGPNGPDRDVYHMPDRGRIWVRLENRSEVPWTPWGGLAEKGSWCALVSGPAVPGDPCSVAPGATIRVSPPLGPGTTVEVRLAPAGLDFQKGLPVILDLEKVP
jgi:Tol biopolymer transport system component